MQIAADTSIVPLEKLYSVCEIAREVMTGPNAVGRIIARPFVHENGRFTRTEDRKDYALEPPGETMLDILSAKGIFVTGVGKIGDLFLRKRDRQKHSYGKQRGGIGRAREFDFESWPRTRVCKPCGYRYALRAQKRRGRVCGALSRIDERLPILMKNLRQEDVLIITADHGCDPTTEYRPITRVSMYRF